MLQRSLLALSQLALVLGTLLVSTAQASAQQGGDPYGYDPFWGSPYYGRGYGYEDYARRPITFASYTPATPTYTSFFSRNQDADISRDAALVQVRVPASAELWFSGEATQQRGLLRDFVTPELKRDKDYFYTLKARWTQDGKQMEQTRRVRVAPGARVMVDFFRSAP